MAVLEKMRKRMGVFISIIIALALLAFIVDPDTLQSTISMFSSKYDVGKIGKKGISYQEFSKRVDYYNSIYNLTGSADASNEETSQMINASAWQSLLTEEVIMPACERAGIRVGEKEFVDMTKGSDISPVLRQEGMMLNANGEFDPERLSQFLQNVEMDNSGNLAKYWNFLENNIIQDRKFLKYSAMLAKSSFANNLQVKRDVADNNNAYDIDFVVQPIGYATDSSINVTSADIKNFYERIKPSLKQDETRDAEMIAFEILPSERDIEVAKADMEKLFPEFVKTADADMKNFIAKNSDVPFVDIYFKKGDISEGSSIVDEFAATNGAGAILEPQPFDKEFVAAKILDVAQRPDSVFVKFLPAKDQKMADSLVRIMKGGEDFATLAAKYFPPQQGVEPGVIGWITESVAANQLPADFLKAFSAKKGDYLTFPLNDNFVVVKVEDMTKPLRKAKVAVLAREATPSRETFSKVYAEANKVVDNSLNDIKKFEKYADENHLSVIPVNRLLGGASEIAGYDNMKEVSRWIYDNKEGAVSQVISVNNKYFVVAAVKKIHPMGYAELSEVSAQIKDLLTVQKKVDKAAKECSEKIINPTDMESLAEALGTTVSFQADVTFASMNGGQSLDPKFIGAVAAAGEKNESGIVGPVKGSIGVYYFQIKDRKAGAYYTEDDAQRKSDNAVYTVLQVLPQIMSLDAGVVDRRYKFY